MKPDEKLRLLGDQAKFDVCGYPRALLTRKQTGRFSFVYQATGEGRACTRLFKVLQTNKCDNNCYYCVNRKDRSYPRISLTPRELADLFMEYYTSGLVEGCFISSAIYKNPDFSQEEIIDTLRIIRKKHRYKGYIHTKILPDASDQLIYEASKYSDRLSINLEAPGQNYLSRLSPDKNFAKLLTKLHKISDIARKRKLKAGVTTQLVVGGAEEPDRTIINLASKLYTEFKLWRVYYSGFIPVKNTPLQNTSICPPPREYRLYQADSLIRKYGFSPEEIPFDKDGFLPTTVDPKLAWANSHPEFFPMEINTADFQKLIRIPGIGKIGAQKIISAREQGKIKHLETLRKMGILVSKTRNFISLNGHKPPPREIKKEPPQKQLFIWEEI